MPNAMRPDWSSDRRLRGMALRNAPVTEPLETDFSVAGLDSKATLISTSKARFFISISVQAAKIPHPNTLVTLKRVQLS